MITSELIVRLERAWALDATALADQLIGQDPGWGGENFKLADGWAVLCGPGLYVNRALGLGLETDIDDEHFELLELRSHAVGVTPALEVCEATHDSVRTRLRQRGYRAADQTTAIVRTLSDVDALPSYTSIIIEAADGQLREWQETSARGWDHRSATRRRASDAFAKAAAVSDDPGLMLARSARDGRLLGCASLAIRDGIATLGGMSTIPEERGRGVQAALIAHRLALAKARGCELASTTTALGGASERNLLRHGFIRSHTKTTFEQQAATAPP